MRGAWFHNLMVCRTAETLRHLGAWVKIEHPVRSNSRTLLADIYAGLGHRPWLVEIERTPDRVPADIEKAIALGVGRLILVAPNRRTADALERRVDRLTKKTDGFNGVIDVVPFGVIFQHFSELLMINDSPVIPPDNKSLSQKISNREAER